MVRAQAKVDAASVRLSKDAVLVINGAGVRIKSLDLDGTLVIDAASGAEVVLDGLKAQNRGWKWQALNPNKEMTEEQAMRCGNSKGPTKGEIMRGLCLLPHSCRSFWPASLVVKPCANLTSSDASVAS